MFDIRYHIASICAVFMMLGVGILIGENITAPAQIKQQTATLASLNQQVNGAVQDGVEAKRRLSRVEQAIDVLRVRTIPGKLAGKRVMIIQCSDYPGASLAAANAIRDAGGTPVATVVITDALSMLSPDKHAALLQSMQGLEAASAPPVESDPSADESSADLLYPLMAALHAGTAGSVANYTLIDALKDSRCVTVTGDITLPCNLFVLIGGRNNDGLPPPAQIADMESSSIRGLITLGPNIQVVGCEPLDVPTSSIPVYNKEQIATVDCIDEPLGQLDLPFALLGGDDKTDYGLKSTATHELPPSLEEQTRP